jgi:tyrosyl-tRNA synthetase
VACGGATSRSDARRKIQQNGVRIDKKTISDVDYKLTMEDNLKIVNVGKKFFKKIIVSHIK